MNLFLEIPRVFFAAALMAAALSLVGLVVSRLWAYHSGFARRFALQGSPKRYFVVSWRLRFVFLTAWGFVLLAVPDPTIVAFEDFQGFLRILMVALAVTDPLVYAFRPGARDVRYAVFQFILAGTAITAFLG